ncbi:hypothetical protein C0Q70_19338 [Pomacea canaliculata]|uniref:Uncharacterized protein n=1 Tax=Pomacea canaliculata TaxID=400727 RepID=A0A2T7NJ09_POMCA|nr:hypothetical protein C0Q70_19338 [Pomacea canaliculata]
MAKEKCQTASLCIRVVGGVGQRKREPQDERWSVPLHTPERLSTFLLKARSTSSSTCMTGHRLAPTFVTSANDAFSLAPSFIFPNISSCLNYLPFRAFPSDVRLFRQLSDRISWHGLWASKRWEHQPR